MNPCAIIDPRLSDKIVKSLGSYGFTTITVPLTDLAEEPLAGHPDIQMFIHNKNLFVHPDIDKSFLKKIEAYINIVPCSSKLDKKFPGDISYNIACTGKIAFHRKENTDPDILDYLCRNEIDIIDTRQGYSKCSTLIVDERSIITADNGIHIAAGRSGVDSLLISQGYINLPGYNYGFIGGSSGRFLDTVYLTGSIDHHPDKERIVNFIESKGMHLNILSKEKIFDAGSIFFIG